MTTSLPLPVADGAALHDDETPHRAQAQGLRAEVRLGRAQHLGRRLRSPPRGRATFWVRSERRRGQLVSGVRRRVAGVWRAPFEAPLLAGRRVGDAAGGPRLSLAEEFGD